MIDASHIISCLSQPAILVDQNGRLAHVNTAAVAMLGHAVQGQHFATALRQPALLNAVETCLKEGVNTNCGYIGKSHTGETAYDVFVNALKHATGNFAFLVFEDISAAEDIGQIRRDFVANVSHELRTPLTAISGFIETLRGPAANDPAASKRFLGLMAAEADRMTNLIKDLLSLSKVEAEQRILPKEAVNILDVIDTVYRRLGPLADEAEIPIHFANDGPALYVKGDFDQLVQVFTNLVENAIKYTSSSAAPSVHIKISQNEYDASMRSPSVRIDVIDTGEGIDPMHIPRLTERFYRVDNHRSRQLGGTGLGLSIVKHIVNRHRGRFDITSVLGKGSQFSVILPKTDGYSVSDLT
ncbi:MAG: ATP-binding protein [Planktomarina sp.]